MSRAFADTYAFLAWLNPDDAASGPVTAFLDAFIGQILTTEWVLMEVADAMAAPGNRSAVVAFIRNLRSDPKTIIVGYDAAVYAAGFNLFANRPDKSWSLTDCISFTVMTDAGLTDALTGDRHFEQAGFRAVFRMK